MNSHYVTVDCSDALFCYLDSWCFRWEKLLVLVWKVLLFNKRPIIYRSFLRMQSGRNKMQFRINFCYLKRWALMAIMYIYSYPCVFVYKKVFCRNWMVFASFQYWLFIGPFFVTFPQKYAEKLRNFLYTLALVDLNQ